MAGKVFKNADIAHHAVSTSVLDDLVPRAGVYLGSGNLLCTFEGLRVLNSAHLTTD
jgi:hypothetical protein